MTFSETERWWLDRMVDVIASSAGITPDDLDEAPFTERGGVDGALRDLGDRTADLINELNRSSPRDLAAQGPLQYCGSSPRGYVQETPGL